MQNPKEHFFMLRTFDGKRQRYKKYKTLRGIEKRIGEKIPYAYEPIWCGANIVWEGNEDHIKLTVFREFIG